MPISSVYVNGKKLVESDAPNSYGRGADDVHFGLRNVDEQAQAGPLEFFVDNAFISNDSPPVPPADTCTTYEFGPTVAQMGPQETVFDHSNPDGTRKDACEDLNIPDLPARAFRDSANRTQLILVHYTNYRMTGSSLDSLSVDCRAPVLTFIAKPIQARSTTGNGLPRPTRQTVRRSTHSYTTSSTAGTIRAPTVRALHRASSSRSAGTAASPLRPRQTGGTATRTQRSQPPRGKHSLPVRGAQPRRRPNQASDGLLRPEQHHSDPKDGRFQVLLLRDDPGPLRAAGRSGPAMGGMRHAYNQARRPDLVARLGRRADADSTSSFEVPFTNPYTYQYTTNDPREKHVCEVVSRTSINNMSSSLTWNTYLNKYLLVGYGFTNVGAQTGNPWDIYYSTSDDLINWSPRQLLMNAEIIFESCGTSDPERTDPLYPTLIDQASTSRNFETTGQHPHLYFTRFNQATPQTCNGTAWPCSLDRDLIRIPIEFSR